MIGHLFVPLFNRSVAPPPPSSGPSGGLSWLRGYKPPFDYAPQVATVQPARRRNRRDEILFLK